MANDLLPATAFKSPAIALSGVVDYGMYTAFRTQFDNASDKSIVVIELSTLGGDPEVARMMGEDVRFASEMEPSRRFVFLGKAAIYSPGSKKSCRGTNVVPWSSIAGRFGANAL